jgi:hypothetical protein
MPRAASLRFPSCSCGLGEAFVFAAIDLSIPGIFFLQKYAMGCNLPDYRA